MFGLRGDRQVYRTSIIVRTALSAALLLASAGQVNVLVPLFAIGVFVVMLLIGEVAPDHWWQQALFNRRGAVVARYVGRHTNALICRLRFRLLPRPTHGPGRRRRSRTLVLPRAGTSD